MHNTRPHIRLPPTLRSFESQATYMYGHWWDWFIFCHGIQRCLYNQPLTDFRSTGAGIRCLHCIPALFSKWILVYYTFSPHNIKRRVCIKLVSHRARSQQDCTRSGQIPLLVNFAELMVVFVLKCVHFVSTSAYYVVTSWPTRKFLKIPKIWTRRLTYIHSCPLRIHYWLTSRSTGSLRVLLVHFAFYWFTSSWLLHQISNTIDQEVTAKTTCSSAKTTH